MIETLKLIQGAVAKKDLVPVMTAVHFYDKRVQATNGRITIDAPFPDLDIDVTVNADRLIKAVNACDGEATIKLTENGKLSIRQGKFRALIPVEDHDSFPKVEPPTALHQINGKYLLRLMQELRPFVAEDATRPWACGMLLDGDYAYATNNVSIARVHQPFDKPVSLSSKLNLPSFLLDELLRMKRPPINAAHDDKSITLDLGDGVWIRSNLFADEWPDVQRFFQPAKLSPIPPELSPSIERILPFCPDPKLPIIILGDNTVSTAEGEMSAAVEGFSLPDARFHAKVLQLVLDHAHSIDLAAYPNPCAFQGDGIDGVVMGVN